MRRNILSQQLKAALLLSAAASMMITANAEDLPVETATEEAKLAAKDALNLGSMVVTASGFAQEVKDAPASISVIGQETINQKPFNNIGDVLKDVEGVNVTRGGKAGGADIGIRGMSSDYTLLMVDGQRVSQNGSGARPNGFGDVDSLFIPPSSAIERIEVVRGPMSTLYGSDALGGVVNVITKKVPDQWGGQVSFSIEEPTSSKFSGGNTTSVYLGGPIQTDLIGLALMGSFQTKRDAKGTYVKNSKGDLGYINNRTGLGERKNFNYGARLTFTPENQEFILNYDRGVQRYDNTKEQQGGLKGNGYADHLRFVRERAGLIHKADLGFASVESSLLWDDTKTIGRLNPKTDPVTVFNDKPRDIKYTNIIFDNKWMFSLGDHFISAGMQYRQQKFKDTLEGAGLDLKQWQWALFAEDEWMIRDDLIATFGLRYDKNEDFGSHFSPRAYLVWNIDDNWQVKGGVSRAFKAPDIHKMTEGVIGLSGQGKIPSLGNPNLKPETATSAELGFSYTNLDNFSTNATIFYSKFKDKIDSVKIPNCNSADNPNSPGCISLSQAWPEAQTFSKATNLDGAKLYGLELGAKYQLNDFVGVSGNYTYTHSSHEAEGGRKLPFSSTPLHMLNVKVDWKINSQWSAWADAEYRAKEYNSLNWHKEKVYYKNYALMNIGASYKPSREMTINAGIDNVFNKNFIDYGLSDVGTAAPKPTANYVNGYRRVEEGRKLWLKLNYEF